MSSLQLVRRDGALLPRPLRIDDDAAGARALAELYAPPAGRTSVRAMMNTTIDGSVTGADGTSGPLRNPDDSLVFGVLRALADVVLVGAGTVRAEDYTHPAEDAHLTGGGHRPGGARTPVLAVLSTTGELPEGLDEHWPLLLLTPPTGLDAARERSGLPAEQVLPAAGAVEALDVLAGRGLLAIQAEGGPGTLGTLAAAGRLDELCFSVTARTVGGSSPHVIDGAPRDQRWTLDSLLLGEEAMIPRWRRRD